MNSKSNGVIAVATVVIALVAVLGFVVPYLESQPPNELEYSEPNCPDGTVFLEGECKIIDVIVDPKDPIICQDGYEEIDGTCVMIPNPEEQSTFENPSEILEKSSNDLLDMPPSPTFYNLVGYRSFENSPFLEFMDKNDVYLEDFEKGGILVPGVSTNSGEVQSPGDYTNSVDTDVDGLPDGNGNQGHSFLTDTTSITFTFDQSKLGKYPSFVGIVVTEAIAKDVWFEVYDTNGNIVDKIHAEIPPIGNNGASFDDRFFGVYNEEGVKGFKVETRKKAGWTSVWLEVDHLQYGPK